MKKYLIPALALGLVMTSCQSDEPFAPGEGGEKQVTFTLNVPGELGTRAGEAYNSGVGGLSNNAGELSYTLVLDADGDQRKFTKTGAGSVVFNPTVVLGREYTVTAYAHFGEAWDGENAIDITKHFNDETKDAYFKQENIKFELKETSKQITLKRPFGKLRLLATDYIADGDQLNTAVKNVKITYNDAKAAKFDVFDSEFEFDGDYVNVDAKTFGYYAAEEDGAMPIFADYVPANPGDNMVDFTVEVTYTNDETYSRTFNDIPVRRNALTTLKGNFFTAGAEITVKVDDAFDNESSKEYDVWNGQSDTSWYNDTDTEFTINTAKELAGFSKLVDEGNTFEGKTVKLGKDIYLYATDKNGEAICFDPIGSYKFDKVFRGSFDGQGYAIRSLNQNTWALDNGYYYNDCGLGLFGAAQDATIKNLIMDNANISGESGLCGVVAAVAVLYAFGNFGYIVVFGAVCRHVYRVGAACVRRPVDIMPYSSVAVAHLKGECHTVGVCVRISAVAGSELGGVAQCYERVLFGKLCAHIVQCAVCQPVAVCVAFGIAQHYIYCRFCIKVGLFAEIVAVGNALHCQRNIYHAVAFGVVITVAGSLLKEECNLAVILHCHGAVRTQYIAHLLSLYPVSGNVVEV